MPTETAPGREPEGPSRGDLSDCPAGGGVESARPTSRRRCGDAGGTTLAGAPCKSFLNLGENGRCVQHDATRADERAALYRAGGAGRGEAKRRARTAAANGVPKPPQTLADAVAWTSWAMHSMAIGTLDARTGHEILYGVARFTESVDKRDLLREAEELRTVIDEMKREAKRPVRIA